ncbi:transglutaminase-like cysteine peptidase [Seleniivibrio woodruffii]|uniref:transglutaminase-like cysteine peptidase n=1 Tax=Seleniivibrio woodruffii TaxID=1078050 RepID=UPI0026F05310|nr:transglutaminase-like cysteine peptidase [Seleniivibrio woodruffii]
MIAILIFGSIAAASKFHVPENVYSQYVKKYGQQAETRLDSLLALMDGLSEATDDKKVIEVNRFFNQVQYQTDMKTWGQSDYWASRLEFLGIGAGDCEDYAVSKFLTLIQLGIPQEKLFLTYVKRGAESHMVVTYYKEPNTVPFVLDNYDKSIQPATKRTDLSPVYSFTANDLFLQKQQGLGKRVDPSQSKNLNKLKAIDLEIMKR